MRRGYDDGIMQFMIVDSRLEDAALTASYDEFLRKDDVDLVEKVAKLDPHR